MADKAGLVSSSTRSATVKELAKSDAWVKRIASLCSNDEGKANRFLSTLIQVVGENSLLAECNAVEVMKCAVIACCLDLDITPTLGFAAIIPYITNVPKKDEYGMVLKGNDGKVITEPIPVPQFQIMTKGFMQLAIRSGYYANINVTEIYEDELVSQDILTGDLQIRTVVGGYRDIEDTEKIVGYACYIETVQGYHHTEYWTVSKISKHGQRFSKTFNKWNSLWKTDFPAMAKKTLLKNTLNKFGVFSTKMVLATRADQSTGGNYDLLPDGSISGGDFKYEDNPESHKPDVSTHADSEDALDTEYSMNNTAGEEPELEDF
ncbi:MAG: recombinase RecT [Sphaerochaeta sp.]